MIPWYWQQLEHGVTRTYGGCSAQGLHSLVDSNLNKHEPEVHLFLSVLISAGKDRDYKFINQFIDPICRWCGLDSQWLLKSFEQIWMHEDVNKQK